MRSLPNRYLEAVPAKEQEHNLFANGVHARTIADTEYYKVLNMEVNCGVPFNFGEDTPEMTETKAQLRMSVPHIQEGTLFLSSPDRTADYYTIDMNRIIPEGWSIKVERLAADRPTSLGVILFHPDHEDETTGVHKLTNADFRAEEEPQCENRSGSSFVYGGDVQCEREALHIGNHQAIKGDISYDWDATGASSASPQGEFGFKNVCPHCGFVVAATASGLRKCGDCAFWLGHKKDGTGFIISGRHYRPGAGGFDGHVFNIVKSDGSKWSGELFTQGKIPEWMREAFPDNAIFLDEPHMPL